MITPEILRRGAQNTILCVKAHWGNETGKSTPLFRRGPWGSRKKVAKPWDFRAARPSAPPRIGG